MANYEDRMLRVLDYIHDHPAEDLSLDRLAEVAAMSRFHWHRVFRGVTGETCAQAVRRIRLTLASHQLVQTDRPIAEIAAACGYPNVTSFNRAFSEAFGLPPAAFRGRGAPAPLSTIPHEGDRTMFPIDIQDHPARRLAAIAHRGAYPGIGKAFEQLGSILGARDLWPRAQGMVGVYYDSPQEVPEAELRSHAGVILPDDVTLEAPLEEVLIPAGRHAVMHHKGPYATLTAAYAAFYGDWLPGADVQVRDFPPFEVYLNSPMDTAPEELRTDICVPIA